MFTTKFSTKQVLIPFLLYGTAPLPQNAEDDPFSEVHA